jgi:HEAT repeat protein
MAGELRIREAVPYITKLIEREDAMQRYAAIWALGRCGSPTEIPLLNSYAGNSTYPYFLRQIATHAMVLLLSDEERQTYVIHYQKVLPVEFQQAIAAGEKQPLATLLHERVKLLTAPSYPLLEDLYIVSTRHQLVREVLLQFLADLPLKSNYFQHIRHLFKQAELRDDHELVALLSIRFEREREMSGEPEGRSKRTAYSKRTRFYLRKRVLRNMKETGKRNDIQYVRFATALLLHYDARKENAIPYKTSKWNYERTTRESRDRTTSRTCEGRWIV